MSTRLADAFDVYIARTRERAVTALALIPLILTYGIGLLIASERAHAGVDFLSPQLLTRLSVPTYVVLQLAFAITLGFYAAFRATQPAASLVRWVPAVLAEGVLWGAFLGTIVLFLMNEVHILAIAPWVDRTVLSAGAGLHEELVFRGALIPATRWLLTRLLSVTPRTALIGAIAVSSLAFSLVHHLAGEPFTFFAFAYRATAGLVFAALYLTRGLAVTAWTHAAYDFSVL